MGEAWIIDAVRQAGRIARNAVLTAKLVIGGGLGIATILERV